MTCLKLHGLTAGSSPTGPHVPAGRAVNRAFELAEVDVSEVPPNRHCARQPLYVLDGLLNLDGGPPPGDGRHGLGELYGYLDTSGDDLHRCWSGRPAPISGPEVSVRVQHLQKNGKHQVELLDDGGEPPDRGGLRVPAFPGGAFVRRRWCC